jgi:hypothetical protein
MQTIDLPISPGVSDAAVVKGVEAAARSVGLEVTLRTSSSTYPGSVHWHFKKRLEKRGTLELTFWPKTKKLWAKIQSSRKADWIPSSLDQLVKEFTGRHSSVREISKDRRTS